MSQQPEQPPAPPITEEMREQARQTPDSWLYIVDPGYESAGDDVPPEGVVGAFRIDENGEIDENFHHNDEYEPTAPPFEPVNELEETLRKIAHGESPDSDLPPAVLGADLLLYAPEDNDEAVYAAEMSDGSQLVPACTSPDRVPESWPGSRSVPGTELPELLGGLDLGLNLDEAVRAVIPYDVLAEVAASHR